MPLPSLIENVKFQIGLYRELTVNIAFVQTEKSTFSFCAHRRVGESGWVRM